MSRFHVKIRLSVRKRNSSGFFSSPRPVYPTMDGTCTHARALQVFGVSFLRKHDLVPSYHEVVYDGTRSPYHLENTLLIRSVASEVVVTPYQHHESRIGQPIS